MRKELKTQVEKLLALITMINPVFDFGQEKAKWFVWLVFLYICWWALRHWP